jgi:DNA-binding NtrC family response regulator
MARKPVRIRPKNQITLPADVLQQLCIGEDDYVMVEVTPQGVAQIVPARLAVVGTPEARESIRRADEDFKAGRYRVYDSGEAFAKSLLSREGLETKSEPEPPSRPIEQIERELIVAVLGDTKWNRERAAEKLGWEEPYLEEKLRQFKILWDTVR